jgi:hypothetical protein
MADDTIFRAQDRARSLRSGPVILGLWVIAFMVRWAVDCNVLHSVLRWAVAAYICVRVLSLYITAVAAIAGAVVVAGARGCAWLRSRV